MKAKEEYFQSATAIAQKEFDDVLGDHSLPDPAIDGIPSVGNLTRRVNRTRQNLRPQEPRGLDFEVSRIMYLCVSVFTLANIENINHFKRLFRACICFLVLLFFKLLTKRVFFQLAEDSLPANFMQKDIRHHGQRQIIFATPTMLHLLAKTKEWFVDGTFKVVRPQFCQLFSIHGSIKNGEHMKQIPFSFVFMSRKNTTNYKAVSIFNRVFNYRNQYSHTFVKQNN